MDTLNFARAKKLFKKADAHEAIVNDTEISVASAWAMLEFIQAFRADVGRIASLETVDLEALTEHCTNNIRRYLLLMIITRTGDAQGLRFVESQLRGGHHQLVDSSIHALVAIGTDEARDVLEKFCREAKSDVADMAKDALTQFSYDDVPDHVRLDLERSPARGLKALVNIESYEATQLLLDHLPSKDNNCRFAAIAGLKGRPERDTFDRLSEYMMGGTARAREDALNLIAAFQSDKAAQAVCAVMKNGRSVNIRKNAALALGKMGNPIIIDALLGVLREQDEDANVVATAIMSLKKLKCHESMPLLVDLVRRQTFGDGQIKSPFAVDLYSLGVDVLHSLCEKDNVEPFDEFVHHDNEYVRLKAIHALRQRKITASYEALSGRLAVEESKLCRGELEKSLKTLKKLAPA